MKTKFLLLAFICMAPALIANAQGFEGGISNPSFTNMCQIYQSADISGKTISQTYYASGAILLGHEVSPEQGITLASYLIQAPSELGLLRNKLNFVPTTAGYICISYLKGEWHLSFFSRATHGVMTTTLGAKMYTLN